MSTMTKADLVAALSNVDSYVHSSPLARDALEYRTKAELAEFAKALDIEGYTTMKKDELVSALSRLDLSRSGLLEPSQLELKTKRDLVAIAKILEIYGYSTMTKDELVSALSRNGVK